MESFKQELTQNKTWLKIAGIVLSLVGLLLCLLTLLALTHYTLYVSVLLVLTCIVLFIHSFRFWYRKPLGFVMHIGAGILYLLFATIFYFHITFRFVYIALLCLAYFLMGCFRLFVGFDQWSAHHGWSLTVLCGAVNIFLSMLGLLYFYNISIGLIILAIGTDILLTGLALLALSFAPKRAR